MNDDDLGVLAGAGPVPGHEVADPFEPEVAAMPE